MQKLFLGSRVHTTIHFQVYIFVVGKNNSNNSYNSYNSHITYYAYKKHILIA